MPRGFFKKGGYNPRTEHLKYKQSMKISSSGSPTYSDETKENAVEAVVKRKVGIFDTARVLGCTPQSIRNWKKGSLSDKKRGRPRKLKIGSPEEKTLIDLADKDPYSRSVELSEQLERDTGVDLSVSGVNRQLYKRADPPFTLKVPDTTCEDKNMDTLIDIQCGYLDGLNHALNTNHVSRSELFFLDEFPLYCRTLPRKGRTRKGKKLYGRVPYMAARFTGVAVISESGCIKSDVIQGNMNDTNFVRFCLESQHPTQDAPNLGGRPIHQLLPEGSYIIWDRLGRSGRCKHPNKLHYNREIRRRLKQGGVQVVFLPPKGHLLNPAELFINAVQERVARWHPPGNLVDEYGHLVVGPRSYEECRVALSKAVAELKPSAFMGFYDKRCSGDHFVERMQESSIYQQVQNERSEVAVIAHWGKNEDELPSSSSSS